MSPDWEAQSKLLYSTANRKTSLLRYLAFAWLKLQLAHWPLTIPVPSGKTSQCSARPKTYASRVASAMDARVSGKPGQQLTGIQKMMVTVLPTASEPMTCRQVSVRLMMIVGPPGLVCSVICVLVNAITFPLASVLFPEGGRGPGVGRGRGVGVGLTAAAVVVVVVVLGVQFTRSVALAKMEIRFFVFIG
jgi:hypothetical protein